jgi:hypothetical protein
MNNKIKAGILTLGAMMLPLVSFAALENFKGLITSVGDIINTIIPLMFAVALIGFSFFKKKKSAAKMQQWFVQF